MVVCTIMKVGVEPAKHQPHPPSPLPQNATQHVIVSPKLQASFSDTLPPNCHKWLHYLLGTPYLWAAALGSNTVKKPVNMGRVHPR